MVNVLCSLNHEPPDTQAAASTLHPQGSSESALWVLLDRTKSLEAPDSTLLYLVNMLVIIPFSLSF